MRYRNKKHSAGDRGNDRSDPGASRSGVEEDDILDLYAFATDRVNGLGLGASEFWACSWRELQARRQVLDGAREFQMSQRAHLQATLFNAHFRHDKNDPIYKAEMFMPGWKEPDERVPSWKRDRDKMLAGWRVYTNPDPSKTKEGQEQIAVMQGRSRRAKEARAAGHGREVIERIMTGRG